MTVSPPAMPARARTLEWIAAACILGCGILLAMPGRTFENSAAYAAFAQIAPEERWASFCIVVGSVRMAALWINGNWRRSPILRGVASILGVGFWTLVLALVMGADLPGPAMILAPIGMAFSIDLISAWRSGRDFIESERAHGRRI